MIAVVTILLALPLGFFVTSRLAANTAYAIAYLWAFTFQGWYLAMDESTGGSGAGFGDGGFKGILPYGVVTLAIFGVGFGLVATGQWLQARRLRARNLEALRAA